MNTTGSFRHRMTVALILALVLQVVVGAVLADAAPPVREPAPSPSSEVFVYIVQRGDTLSGIAARFGIPAKDIVQLNGLFNPNLIYAGQRLQIPKHKTRRIVYVVRPGDTLWSIGTHFNVSPFRIATTNGISNPNLIFPGQRLVVPKTTPTVVKYKVKPGDTLTRIGARFKVSPHRIAAANGISNPDLIYPGMVLNIPQ